MVNLSDKQHQNQAGIHLSERALIARINRQLIKEDQILRKNRNQRGWDSNLGYYYIVNVVFNSIDAAHCDLERLGREVGVLRSYETLAPE